MRMPNTTTRRAVMGTALCLAALPRRSFGARLAATPACEDAHDTAADLTLADVEGPYFKPGSPERADFLQPGFQGHVTTIEGWVYSSGCRPLPHVLLDLWHADQNGLYDESGYQYRGHMFTDAAGRYRFRTIEPAVYPGRTRHFHLKLQAPGKPILTTQLFFPGEPRNRVDPIFRPELLMAVRDSTDLLSTGFDFVLDA